MNFRVVVIRFRLYRFSYCKTLILISGKETEKQRKKQSNESKEAKNLNNQKTRR